MAQIRGQVKDPITGKYEWVPLKAVLEGSEYVLQVSGVVSGGGETGITLGVPKHYNGIANIAPATVSFAAVTKSIFIENLDAVNSIYVSFDAGASLFVLPSGESIALDAEAASVNVSSSVNGTVYQILTTE